MLEKWNELSDTAKFYVGGVIGFVVLIIVIAAANYFAG
jgi:hypothetical protein